ncbi:MAG: putative acetolactate synthase large subunit IlvX [Syntrophorhabdaceae bacterium PtaU1.Bin034]|nr:MAG: putative acetolactate synthase large subunit IlvX [Syntrophorhabdaceae bacterium PtaU1.Bin034]
MNGAELLVKTALAADITICFSNPGTTEIPVVAALDTIGGIKPVLGLFEGVCTGAADGYGRITGKPAMTLLHLGPGFANGIANLHNARRARTPIVNVIGEHATWHVANDPPLAMDIASLAGTVSVWQRTSTSANEVGRDMADAVTSALAGRITTLIVPNDLQQMPVSDEVGPTASFAFNPVNVSVIERAARMLKSGKKAALFMGGRALREGGLHAAARIKAATGCDLLAGSFPVCMDRGAGLPAVRRIPYFPEAALGLLSNYEAFVFAGAAEPVSFFGYPGIPGRLLAENRERISVWTDGQDEIQVLENLADALGAPPLSRLEGTVFAASGRPALPTGQLTAEKVCLVLAALQPEGAIIVDEGLTTAFSYYGVSGGAPRHSLMTIAGGSIGYGLPCATGAALASPGRRIISFQADGSALYTVQALWTQAREGLDITTLICSNRSYRIIETEFSRSGMESLGSSAKALSSLSPPSIDWVSIARGFGVPAVAVETAEALVREIGTSLSEPGPRLIEMLL